jgi:hypothetical protein
MALASAHMRDRRAMARLAHRPFSPAHLDERLGSTPSQQRQPTQYAYRDDVNETDNHE